MSNLAAVLVVALTSALSAALFFVGKVGNYEGNLGIAVSVIEGIFLGVAVGIGLVALYGLTPMGKRHHWRVRWAKFQDGTEGVSLQSQHWHTVKGFRCQISGPDGKHWNVPWPQRPEAQTLVNPGTSCATFNFNEVLGHPPASGVYRFKWLVDATKEEKWKPIVLATAKRRLP